MTAMAAGACGQRDGLDLDKLTAIAERADAKQRLQKGHAFSRGPGF
jgi:hypothetical protein